MAEKIKLGDTFYKEVYVTREDEDGEDEAVDLAIYDDNFVVIKKDRMDADEDALIFLDAPVKGDPKDGTLIVRLTPQDTAMLPLPSDDQLYLYGFVQIGSSITGEVHEVAEFKIKTVMGGVHHITEVDRGYDMGNISELVGYVFDGGALCDSVSLIIDFDEENMGRLLYNGGSLTSGVLEIYDPGELLDPPEVTDLGRVIDCYFHPSLP